MKIDNYGNIDSTNSCSVCKEETLAENYPVYQESSFGVAETTFGSTAAAAIRPRESIRKTCCCKKSMIEALKLLCDTELSNLIDFEKFAFLTDNFVVGSKLVLLKAGSKDKDNLGKLEGKFKRFAPCNCDLIDIEGKAAYDFPLLISVTDLAEQLKEFIKKLIDLIALQEGAFGTLADILKAFLEILDPVDLTEEILQAIIDFLTEYFTTIPMVSSASLCSLKAIAFQVKYEEALSGSGEVGDNLTEENYLRAKCILQKQLDRGREKGCAECKCHCDCDDCCCTEGVLNELFNSNLSRKATLTVGNLTLREVSVLGVKGDVLVLGNDEKRRFYFVCANAVEFLA